MDENKLIRKFNQDLDDLVQNGLSPIDGDPDETFKLTDLSKRLLDVDFSVRSALRLKMRARFAHQNYISRKNKQVSKLIPTYKSHQFVIWIGIAFILLLLLSVSIRIFPPRPIPATASLFSSPIYTRIATLTTRNGDLGELDKLNISIKPHTTPSAPISPDVNISPVPVEHPSQLR